LDTDSGDDALILSSLSNGDVATPNEAGS